jgi:hypothetical protein
MMSCHLPVYRDNLPLHIETYKILEIYTCKVLTVEIVLQNSLIEIESFQLFFCVQFFNTLDRNQ